MAQELLLMIGSPRSGTTLLNAMVGSHPEVAMLNEDFGHAVFNIIATPMVGNKLCVPNQIEMTERGSWIRRQVQKRGYLQYKPQSDLSITDYLDRNARVIASVRHPDPVISSIEKRGKKGNKLAAYRWVRAIEIIDELHRTLGDRLLLVGFPYLVASPEKVMRRVSEFLEISFDEAMLEGYAHTPIYSNKTIDSSKASELDMPVSELVQDEYGAVVDMYRALLSLSGREIGEIPVGEGA